MRDRLLEDIRYEIVQNQMLKDWEDTCVHCGACCGAYDADPCEHLVELESGKYTCSIYEDRFGMHKTKKGNTIKCVPIREILHEHWKGDSRCQYKR